MQRLGCGRFLPRGQVSLVHFSFLAKGRVRFLWQMFDCLMYASPFGNIHVLQNINLEIEDGEFMVFVGPSGCGKSTLLRVIAGLEDISAGELKIGGRLVNDVPPADRGIAMVFQSYALYPHMSLRENMAFGLKLAKMPKAEIDAAVDQAAKILNIEHLLERRPKDLSGGKAPARCHWSCHCAQTRGLFIRRALVQPGRCASGTHAL